MAPRASSARRADDGVRPILCAVLDGPALARGDGPGPRAFAAALFAAGVDWIQLRERSLEGAALHALARALVSARDAAERAARVIVNKRVDVALASGADGVHLGVDAVDPKTARALLANAEGALLGASLHGASELDALVDGDAPLDYVQLAPIWNPRSKPVERPALGLDALRAAASRANERGWRLLAQGGIDAARAAAVVAAGAAGIAVTGIISQASDPIASARALRHALDAQAAGGSGA